MEEMTNTINSESRIRKDVGENKDKSTFVKEMIEKEKQKKQEKRKKIIKRIAIIALCICLAIVLAILGVTLLEPKAEIVHNWIDSADMLAAFNRYDYNVSFVREDDYTGKDLDILYGVTKQTSYKFSRSNDSETAIIDSGDIYFWDCKDEESAIKFYERISNARIEESQDRKDFTKEETHEEFRDILITNCSIDVGGINVSYVTEIVLRIDKFLVNVGVVHYDNTNYENAPTIIAKELFEKSKLEFSSKGLKYYINKDGESFSAAIGNDHKYKNIIIPSTYKGKPVTNICVSNSVKGNSVTNLIIPDSVTSIGEKAFWGCTSLTSIDIPDSVTSIGESAFSGCTSLTSIDIPDSVTGIGKYAFSNCTSLTSIEIPDSVTSIGSFAFWRCTSLTDVVIGDSVTDISRGAFYDCTSLTNVEIPNSVTEIGQDAFNGCTSLTSIDIPDSVTYIDFQAFLGCIALTRIVIPDSVTLMSSYVFAGCDSLTIYCEASSQPSKWAEGWNTSERPVVWGYKGE